MLRYFAVELSEKRPKPGVAISREAAEFVLKKVADNLGVGMEEFTITNAQEWSGVFYVVFYRESYRKIFMLYIKAMGVTSALMDKVPRTVKFSPTRTSMPPLTKKAKEAIEGLKFYESTLKMIREELGPDWDKK